MSRHILIVDDESMVRDVLRRKLESCGYDVREAANGDEALRVLESATFDLVVTDIVMPGRDGLEMICYLRKQRPGVKVIAISAPSNDLFLQSAAGLGAARTFEKPLKLSELAAAIDELLAV
jgi:CheY-like chemotaxis protein